MRKDLHQLVFVVDICIQFPDRSKKWVGMNRCARVFKNDVKQKNNHNCVSVCFVFG